MKKYVSRSTIVIMFFLCISCDGQNNVNLVKEDPKSEMKQVDFLSSPHGPKSITRTIKQDKNGIICFATWEGIIQFDGTSFTNITKDVSQSRFFSVLEDSRGNMWYGSIGSGVYFYDGKSFQNYTTMVGLINDSVTNIYEDRKGNIWFSTLGGASCFNGKYFRNFTVKDGLPDNDVNAIIEDENGIFWFGTRGDACTFDGTTFTTLTKEDGSTFKNVRHVIEDRHGSVWLGGADGLWQHDGKEFINFTKNFVGYIYEDRKGNIWTSSESTVDRAWVLSRYDEVNLKNPMEKASEVMAGQGMLFGILEDSDENIWVGTLKGTVRYDGNNFRDF